MKILMYTVININGSFGSGLHVKQIAEKLKSKGHDLIVFAPSFNGPARNFKFPVVYLAPKGNGEVITKFFQDMMAIIKLFSLITKQWKPDIVYSRFGLSTIFLPIACKILNIHYITELNGSHLKDIQYKGISEWLIPFLLAVERLNYLCSKKIITVSDELTKSIKKINGVKEKNVLTIHNGVDVDNFKIDDSEFRKRIRGSAQLVFGFVGRFEKWHGLPNVIEALAILKKEKPRIAKNIKLILIGVGTEQKALESQIEITDTKDIIVQTGWVDHQNVPKYLACIDVALAPYVPYSKNTGSQYACPLKILEYLAAEKWIITVNTIFSEIIKTNQAGYILNELNSKELLNAMIYAWENRDTIFNNLNKSSDYVQKNYSWNIAIEKIEKIMYDCITDEN